MIQDFDTHFQTYSPELQHQLAWLVDFADAFEEDYHSTKGNPRATLEENAQFIRAGEAEIEFARKYLVSTSGDTAKLKQEGYVVDAVETYGHSRPRMYELNPPGLSLLYLPLYRLYLDPATRTTYQRQSYGRLDRPFRTLD